MFTVKIKTFRESFIVRIFKGKCACKYKSAN